ncbi:MAG TPA: FAD-dependent oxidoreductase [Jatrophihabitantaceae bacterium]|jgi:sarcosine oxidase|nr:FAD-dependent oxidoreductase [Jatrophihabitantaceae bacterium]
MADHRDVLIVGAGLMGAAAAWAASRAGLAVTIVEQFAPGHRFGSSHGSARIVRRAYGDELYTQLSGRSLELWRELESDERVRVLRMLGGLDFGSHRDTAAIAERLARVGAAHEVLSAAEAEARWPGMRFTGSVVFHPEAGVLDAEVANAALLSGAIRRGAQAVHEVAVRSIAVGAGGRGIRARLQDGTELTADQVVIAAGAWVQPLLDPLTAELPGLHALPPLTVTQQQVFHFPRVDTAAPAWPSVIHDDGDGVYHLAGGRDGGSGDDRKIGEHYRGAPTTADARDGRIDPRSRERVIEYVRRWLPGLEPVPSSATTCLYTTTPSEDFLIDRIGPVVICSACSGHGAKFAPLVGELVTVLVTGRTGGAWDVPERFRLAAHAATPSGRVSL